MKKAISIYVIIFILTVSLCGCSVYAYNPTPEEFDSQNIIGHTYDEIIETYGEPHLINGIGYKYFDFSEPIRSISYITRDYGIDMFGLDYPQEHYYIEFDENTGLANVAFHPIYKGF